MTIAIILSTLLSNSVQTVDLIFSELGEDMETFLAATFEDFKHILDNKKDKEKTRVHIINETCNDIINIVNYYNDYLSQNIEDSKYVYLNITIHINTFDDYYTFLDFYCVENGTKLNSKYEKVEFGFIITLHNQADILLLSQYQNFIFAEFGDCCKGMSAKVDRIENLDSFCVLNPSMFDFQSLIRNNVNIFKDVKYNDKYVVLNVDVSEKGFDLNKLHNNLLICYKYRNECKGFLINIKGDISRIKPYVQSVISDNTFVICNNILIVPDLDSVGKLPPAIFFNAEDLLFFKRPLSESNWRLVIGDRPISAKTFGDSSEKRYWTYIRICQKFLFEEFDDNVSAEYTKLRKTAYSKENFFYEYVHKMPFLALCIFAIYDNFYRNNLLKQAKKYYGKKVLKPEDLLLSEQRKQRWNDYVKYQSNKDRYDIKNLFAYDEKSGLHKTVISEIFECISIAEGLLQILENAVLHAGGGLLSMRVYSREIGLETEAHIKKHHVKYLNDTYTQEYFKYKKANFYLEIRISDLSGKSIPDKFVENLLAPENQDNYDKLISAYKSSNQSTVVTEQYIKDIFKNSNHNMEYFFGEITEERLKEFRQLYYSIDENLVHHYGLEIFNNILTVRNGLFCVCGYGLQIDNLDLIFDKIYSKEIKQAEGLSKEIKRIAINQILQMKKSQTETVRTNLSGNKAISGTTYSILFPLIHSALTENAISAEETLSYNKQDSNMYAVKIINSSEMLKDVDCNTSNRKMIINKIASNIIEIFEEGKVTCFNIFNKEEQNSLLQMNCFEEMIKGVILFALRKLNTCKVSLLPIAIVNLTSFQLIEASRIISIYYAKEVIKHTDTTNPFEKMPIYLKCAQNGKEIVFNGKDIEEVKMNVVKTAMVNGTMFDELSTIVEILRKEVK